MKGLDALFYPRGVAVVGSAREGKIGYELLKQLVEGGYGQLSVVNPKGEGNLGVPGYRAVAEIPDRVDLAVVAAPAATVAGVLEGCGEVGVGAAVVITSGFSEVGNVAGEKELLRVARRYGLRFVGPNCAGILNTGHALYPTLELRPPPGKVAFISQSGALGGAVLAWAEEQGVGFSKFVSYGNAADVGAVELLAYLAEDDETEVVALYIESVEEGRAFMRAVRAFTAQKPLVVIKSGRTETGRRATLSHTGSLAGSDAVYDVALRQAGALRVHSVEELFDLCRGFVHLPPVGGDRVAIVTNSGGPGVLAADRAEELGLQVSEPGPMLRERLSEFLPAYCSLRNPIDMTVEGTEEGYRRTLEAVLTEYDAALALDVCPPYLDAAAHARGVCAAAAGSEKPVVANFMAGQTVAEALPELAACGVPNFVTGERAMGVLARMAEYQARRGDPAPLPVPPDPVGALDLGESLEPEAMAWLRAEGVPVPSFHFAATPGEAVAGARSLGYPVVMKVVSPQILHKSDVGGVKLNLTGDDAVRRAFAALAEAAAGREFRGVVLYPLLRGGLEVLLGLSRDPQFGPVVAFGLGGIYTEVLHDVALRVAPLDRAGAEALVREVRAYPLLEGVRGQPARDVEALVELLVTLSRLPFLYPNIAEMDLNPVFVFEEGRGVLVGDVRVIGQ